MFFLWQQLTQDNTYFIKIAASFSVNFPLAMISSKSSPPLQILDKNISLIEWVVLLSNNVISFFILEKFVHLHNVWMILKFFQNQTYKYKILEIFINNIIDSENQKKGRSYKFPENINFIKEHFFLLFVHFFLSQNFYCSLST